MPDKEDDFDGEYDFYDGGFNEDERKDREGDEEDLDFKKEKEHKEFLSKRQRELDDTLQAFLANGNYEMKYPNVSYSDTIENGYVTFLFTGEDEKTGEHEFRMLSEEDLELFVKGKLKIDKSLEEVMTKWYPLGTYRYFRMLSELRRRYEKENDESKWKNLEDLIDIHEEKFRTAKMIELSAAFDEGGNRLKDLYLAIYGRTDKRFLRFGSFRIGIPILFYNDEMKKLSYRESDDFFEDFKNVYDFIFSLNGNYAIGTLTDEVYEYIGGYARAETTLFAEDLKCKIQSTIAREEWFNRRACNSLVSNINLKNEDLLFWIHKYHPEFDAVITDEDTVLFWCKDEIKGEYLPEAKNGFNLAVKGSIEKQKEVILGLINYVAKKKPYDGLF